MVSHYITGRTKTSVWRFIFVFLNLRAYISLFLLQSASLQAPTGMSTVFCQKVCPDTISEAAMVHGHLPPLKSDHQPKQFEYCLQSSGSLLRVVVAAACSAEDSSRCLSLCGGIFNPNSSLSGAKMVYMSFPWQLRSVSALAETGDFVLTIL